jgi:hypothetical protein
MCCGQKRSELGNSQAQMMVRTVPQYPSGNKQVQGVRTQPLSPPAVQTISPHRVVNTQVRSVLHKALTPISVAQPSTRVRYLENSPIRVRGPVSGTYYEFSGSRPVQLVTARDASSLLNTRFFRRA